MKSNGGAYLEDPYYRDDYSYRHSMQNDQVTRYHREDGLSYTNQPNDPGRGSNYDDRYQVNANYQRRDHYSDRHLRSPVDH